MPPFMISLSRFPLPGARIAAASLWRTSDGGSSSPRPPSVAGAGDPVSGRLLADRRTDGFVSDDPGPTFESSAAGGGSRDGGAALRERVEASPRRRRRNGNGGRRRKRRLAGLDHCQVAAVGTAVLLDGRTQVGGQHPLGRGLVQTGTVLLARHTRVGELVLVGRGHKLELETRRAAEVTGRVGLLVGVGRIRNGWARTFAIQIGEILGRGTESGLSGGP